MEEGMDHANLSLQLAALPQLSITELRRRYAEAFGEPTPAANKTWLIKRIAWRLQALAEGDLSQRARQRALVLANDADIRLSPPRTPRAQAGPELRPPKPAKNRDRLPPPGTILHRPYKGQVLEVKILEQGCQFEGRIYRSLSAVAKAITGSHCSGLLFFGLAKRGAAS
jgi:Protein of unknown function (DUF2924)